MKYEISPELKDIIIGLCDLALKAGGLQNKEGVDKVLDIFIKQEIDK